METKRIDRGGIMSGVVLILLGLVFFAATLGVYEFNWGNIWPAFIGVYGLVLLGQAFMVEEDRRAAPTMWGTMLVLLAWFFFATTLGYISWADQSTLWPIYLLIVGAGGLAGYFAAGMDKNSYLITGVVTAVAGLAFLAATLAGWLDVLRFTWLENIFKEDWAATWWPLVLISAGLFLFLLAFLAEGKGGRAGLTLAGTIPFLLGSFFLATTLGYLSWEDQGRLWPLYPMIVGVAFVAGYFASGREFTGFLVPAAVLCSVGLVFLGLALTSFELLGQLWPLALIVAGLALLFLRRDQIPGIGGQGTPTHMPHNP